VRGLIKLAVEVFFRFLQVLKASICSNLILTRTACLGNDAIGLMGLKKYYFLNIQKGRVDYLNHIFSNLPLKIKLSDIKLILRNDIRSLFIQQVFGYPAFLPLPKYFILDTYSELTDQRFEPINTSFSPMYFNFSDLDKEFNHKYNCSGLLPLPNILSEYDLLINNLKSKYQNINIIFILFPAKFDKREVFNLRYNEISKALKVLNSEYDFVHLIEVPDYLIENADDEYPYHFKEITKNYISQQLKSLIQN
jgi:hypothetical protein